MLYTIPLRAPACSCARVHVHQVTHVVSCITDAAGKSSKGAQKGVRYRTQAEKTAKAAGAEHVTWPTSEKRLGLFVFFCAFLWLLQTKCFGCLRPTPLIIRRTALRRHALVQVQGTRVPCTRRLAWRRRRGMRRLCRISA